MTEQERFEEWAKGHKEHYFELQFNKVRQHYYSSKTRLCWESWQAAIASREKDND